MRFTGENKIGAPVDKVWDALLDPRTLLATIPGCERLEETGEHAYSMTVSAGIAAIKGTYSGSCALADLEPHQGLTMHLKGAGGPGTINATVAVAFRSDDQQTILSYDADAVVGGMVGGVGQRMLTSVSRKMAAEFFGNIERVIANGIPEAAVTTGTAPGEGTSFTAPPAPSRIPQGDNSFLTGAAVGAVLVLAGVIVGGILGLRR